MTQAGIEPGTLTLVASRSNQLSWHTWQKLLFQEVAHHSWWKHAILLSHHGGVLFTQDLGCAPQGVGCVSLPSPIGPCATGHVSAAWDEQPGTVAQTLFLARAAKQQSGLQGDRTGSSRGHFSNPQPSLQQPSGLASQQTLLWAAGLGKTPPTSVPSCPS